MPAPFFSVIIPTFNSGPKLNATLRSVFDQIGGDGEVIVMDGGSADGTPDLLRRLQGEHTNLIWRSGPDCGVYDAMNKGIALASGSYLYFAGAGDRLRPGALRRIREVAPAHGPALVYGDVRIVSSDRLHGGGGVYTPARLVYDAPCHQAVFYGRTLFNLLGAYETRYAVSADWAFNLKCFGDDRVQTLYVPTVVADFEGGGLSSGGPDEAFLRDRARLIRERLGRDMRGDWLFATDQRLALRIAGARSFAARKFWRVGRWAWHRFTGPKTGGTVTSKDMTHVPIKPQKIPGKAQAALYRSAARLFRVVGRQLWRYGSTRKSPPLIPLTALMGRDAATLAAPPDWTISRGKGLRNAFLASALAGDELGAWALDAQTINFLEAQISSLRPSAILEFGAGISTICFARFMHEQGHRDAPVVLSVEQNEWEAGRTRARLAGLGLDRLVTIVHAPLTPQTIAGRTTECYDLPPETLEDLFRGAKPDLVVIDGPAGDDGVRSGTLPLVRGHLAPRAAFFLDDAFRPEEIEVARHWAALASVRIAGVYRVGKGLLAGTIETQSSG